MRVLIAAGIYPPDAGGPAVHAKKQFEEFPKFGIGTGLVAFAHYRDKWPKLISHLFFFLALLIKVPFYDLVYAHDAVGTGIPALMAARIFGKKFVVRIGGDIAWERHAESENVSLKEWYESGVYKKDFLYKMSRWLIQHADLVTVISSLQVEVYKKYYGRDVTLVLNPLNEIPNLEVTPERTIIFASRLTAYKNLPIVLRALTKVFQKHPEVRFLVMGNGPEYDNLSKLIESLNLSANVSLEGKVSNDEVNRKTASSLFTIAPALTEFNPNYVMQGIALGKPFLISRENSLPFAVPEYLTLGARSEEDIETKIENLLLPKNYEEALAFVRSIDLKMSWEDNLRKNAELIKTLLGYNGRI